MDWIKQLTAGTIGGVSCTLVGYPFDTFKTRMQMGVHFRELIQTTSFRQLFVGITAPLCGAMPCWAAGYFGYNLGKKLLSIFFVDSRETSKKLNDISGLVPPIQLLGGGITSGLLVSLIRCPIDAVKIKCQHQGYCKYLLISIMKWLLLFYHLTIIFNYYCLLILFKFAFNVNYSAS